MHITAAEAEVMKPLWRKAPQTAEDIIGAVGPSQGWSEGTIKALLNRLLNKGAVGAVKSGRKFLYRPLVTHADYVQTESQGLVDRLFEGRVAPLVAHLSKQANLSPHDIAELKRLVAELDDGK